MAQEHGTFIVLSLQPGFFSSGGVLAPVSIHCAGKPSPCWIIIHSNPTIGI